MNTCTNAQALFGDGVSVDGNTTYEDLVLAVDGGAPFSVTLSENCDTTTNCVTAIGRLNGAVVSESDGNLVITTTSTGADSRVAIGFSGAYVGTAFTPYNFASSSGTYIGASFAGYDFSEASHAEPLIITVDGVDQSIDITANIRTVTDAVGRTTTDDGRTNNGRNDGRRRRK